jgi:hypothetical protein
MTDAFPENVERLTGNAAAKPLIDLTVARFNGLTIKKPNPKSQIPNP